VLWLQPFDTLTSNLIEIWSSCGMAVFLILCAAFHYGSSSVGQIASSISDHGTGEGIWLFAVLISAFVVPVLLLIAEVCAQLNVLTCWIPSSLRALTPEQVQKEVAVFGSIFDVSGELKDCVEVMDYVEWKTFMGTLGITAQVKSVAASAKTKATRAPSSLYGLPAGQTLSLEEAVERHSQQPEEQDPKQQQQQQESELQRNARSSSKLSNFEAGQSVLSDLATRTISKGVLLQDDELSSVCQRAALRRRQLQRGPPSSASLSLSMPSGATQPPAVIEEKADVEISSQSPDHLSWSSTDQPSFEAGSLQTGQQEQQQQQQQQQQQHQQHQHQTQPQHQHQQQQQQQQRQHHHQHHQQHQQQQQSPWLRSLRILQQLVWGLYLKSPHLIPSCPQQNNRTYQPHRQ